MDGTDILEKELAGSVEEPAAEPSPAAGEVPQGGAFSPDMQAEDIPVGADSPPDDGQTSMNVDIYVSEYIEEFTGEAVSETERIIAETEEENERLDNLFRQQPQAAAPVVKEKAPYTIGIVSAALSLIYIGIVLLAALLSPADAFKAVYFAPAILIFIGGEAVFAMIRRRSMHLTFDLKSMIICVALIIITFILSAISKVSTPADVQRTVASDRIKYIISKDISEVLSCDYIRNVDAKVTLCADDPSVYDSPDDLIVGDTVDITIYFSDAKMSVREFASDCRRTLDELATLNYAFGEVKFINDDNINRYTISIEWLYQQNYDELRLAEQAAYFGDNISDTDIADIEDDEDT